jgi:excisionase family DNA binding protein
MLPNLDIDSSFVALSPAAAAKALGVSRQSIYNLLAAGKISARKFGTRTLVDADSVRRYFATLPAFRTRPIT